MTDQAAKTQRIHTRSPLTSLQFDVTLKRLRPGPGRTSPGSADCDAEHAVHQPNGSSASPESQSPQVRCKVEADGSITRLDEPADLVGHFAIHRIIQWQTKIVSRSEVCIDDSVGYWQHAPLCSCKLERAFCRWRRSTTTVTPTRISTNMMPRLSGGLSAADVSRRSSGTALLKRLWCCAV